MNLRSIAIWTGKAIVAGILAAAVLSVIVIACDFTGVHVTSQNGATDYVWEPYQIKTNITEGYAWLRMDENGYNNVTAAGDEEDGSRNVDILLMGSSHMEGLQVAADENTGYLLNELLPEYDTYNIGMSGHEIYTCVDNLLKAQTAYDPQYTLIETHTVELSMDSMQSVVDGTYEELTSYDSGLIYYLQKYIPAAKAMYKSLSDWNSASADASGTDAMTVLAADSELMQEIAVSADSDTELPEGYRETLRHFLAMAGENAGDSTLIIFYHPTILINADGSSRDETDPAYLACFREVCEEYGIVFVDLTDAFEELYEEEHRLAHGFTNTAVGVGHLNRYGHRIAAETLAEVITGLEDG